MTNTKIGEKKPKRFCDKNAKGKLTDYFLSLEEAATDMISKFCTFCRKTDNKTDGQNQGKVLLSKYNATLSALPECLFRILTKVSHFTELYKHASANEENILIFANLFWQYFLVDCLFSRYLGFFRFIYSHLFHVGDTYDSLLTFWNATSL